MESKREIVWRKEGERKGESIKKRRRERVWMERRGWKSKLAERGLSGESQRREE